LDQVLGDEVLLASIVQDKSSQFMLNLTIVVNRGIREVSCSLLVIRIRNRSSFVIFSRETTSGKYFVGENVQKSLTVDKSM